MSRVAVIGGGVGALAAALRMAALGHQVEVFERNSVVGGKLAAQRSNGFSFDTGPSLLTWPQTFVELFAQAGLEIGDYVHLIQLEQVFRYNFSDGSSFETFADVEHTRESIATNINRKSADEWASFMTHSKQVWEVANKTFLANPMLSAPMMLRDYGLRSLLHIDALRTLAQRSKAAFSDPRMQMWLNRYATYSGSDPWRTPASVSCIPHLEQSLGAWHIEGGVANLAEALSGALTKLGVRLHLNQEVTHIRQAEGKVSGVETSDKFHRSDVVIAGCDADVLYSQLLPPSKATQKQLRRLNTSGKSTSGMSILASVTGRTNNLAHHNIWFSDDQRQEFRQLAKRQLADEPTVYACVSSVTDSSQAPAGCENWFILVNTPAYTKPDDDYASKIVSRLPIASRVITTTLMTPDSYALQSNSPGGAIYGSASNSSRTAFLRPSNRGPRAGLFLVGGSTHPGGGLPLVAQSARIATELANSYLGNK